MADQIFIWLFIIGQSLWVQAWPTAYELYARSVCDIQCCCSCGMHLVMLYKPLPFNCIVLFRDWHCALRP